MGNNFATPDMKLTYTAEQIKSRTAELAKEINEWMNFTLDPKREQLLAVCVLRGGVFFFSDLLRELDQSVDPVFCRAESYPAETLPVQGKGVKVSVDEVKPAGRNVLIVDDICDTGLTLLKLHNLFLELGAKSVRSCVLVHREGASSKYEPAWHAFTYTGPEWFVGYGFDNGNDRYRNLPDVYVVPPRR